MEIANNDTNKIRAVWQNKTLKKVFLDIISNTQLQKCKQVKRLIVRLINELLADVSITDEQIYARLFAYVHTELSKDLSNKIQHKEEYRVVNRANKIANFIAQYGNGMVAKSVLDIGCDDGCITNVVGKLLQLPQSAMHGCDIVPLKDECVNNFTFHQSVPGSAVLPFLDGQHDLVYAFMSLHHIQDCVGVLREIHRTLRPGGLFVIREHDCVISLPGYSDVLDVMHGFYSMVWSNPQEKVSFKDEYWSRYWPARELDVCIQSLGFKMLLNTSKPREKFPQYSRGKVINPLRYYYAVYRKV